MSSGPRWERDKEEGGWSRTWHYGNRDEKEFHGDDGTRYTETDYGTRDIYREYEDGTTVKYPKY